MQRPRCLYFRDVTAELQPARARHGMRGGAADSTAPTPSSAPATSAWPPIPPISRWPWSRWTPSSCTRDGPDGERRIPVADFFRLPGDHAGPGTRPAAGRAHRRPSRCRPARTRAGLATSRSATGSPTSSRSPRRRWRSTSRAAPSARRRVAVGGVAHRAVAAARRRTRPGRHAGCARLWADAAARAADGAKPLSRQRFQGGTGQTRRRAPAAPPVAALHDVPAAAAESVVGAPMARVDGTAEGDRRRHATPPTTRCPTSSTPSLVCSTVASGSVDRIDSSAAATSTRRAAGAHRLQPGRSCPTTSAGWRSSVSPSPS